MSNLSQTSQNHPKFSWIPVLLHFAVANILAWVIQANHALSLAAVRVAEDASQLIPSISGYLAMAPNPGWAALYLLIAWLGAPFYISFFWRLTGSVLPGWVAEQKPVRFWAVCFGSLVGAVGALALPQKHIHISDATESVRSTAILASLMKESSIVFAIVTLTVVCTFSFALAVPLRSILLRLFGVTSNLSEGNEK